MSEIELGEAKVYTKVSKVEERRPDQDIEWSDVSFTVGQHQILKNCWGKVEAAEIMAIMGPSGSGKSSLLNVEIFIYDLT